MNGDPLMIGRCLCLISVVFLTASGVFSQEQQNDAAAPGSVSSTRDLVFFDRKHPIFIRLRIEIDQTSFERAWIEHVQSLFAELDADADGILLLNEITAKTATTADASSAEALRLARDRELWSADRSPLDQAITIDELTTFLVNSDRGPFQTQDTKAAPGTNSAVGTMLFQRLDLNKDFTLSADELAAAMRSLHRRDLDDDGTFGISELGESANPYVPMAVSAPTEADQPFVTLTPGSASIGVVREFERRYAGAPPVSSGNRETLSRDLRRENLGLEAHVYDQYDVDADGTLDRDELRELIRRPPVTLQLLVRLGTRADGSFVVEMTTPAGDPGIALRRSADGLASIVINDVQIEIAQAADGPDAAKEYLLGQFAAFDTDNNDYVDEKEASRSEALKGTFAECDEDGDGKLFENELTAAVDGRMKAARSRTRMNISNQGRNLFEILDSDRSRSLGRRELSQAVKRIELWDTDGDGAVSESEIPQLYQITFGLGLPEFRGFRIPGEVMRLNGEAKATMSDAPVWFRKLDRNGDGELARREFPGTLAEFQTFDENTDGVLDTKEAEFVK